MNPSALINVASMREEAGELVIVAKAEQVEAVRSLGPLKPALLALSSSAKRIGVDEPLLVIAREFAQDLDDITAGLYTTDALDDAMRTLANARAWSRTEPKASSTVKLRAAV